MANVSPLRRFQEENGLTDEGLAALASDALNEEIDAEKIKTVKKQGGSSRRRVERALGLLDERPTLGATRSGDDEPPIPGADNPVQKPPRPDSEVPDVLDWRNVREALIAMYSMVGKGVSMVRRNPEIEVVFQKGAPVLADDWIALAKVDARTRGVLERIMVVGPSGRLAMDHLVLIGHLVTLEKNVSGAAAAAVPGPTEFVPFIPGEEPAAGGNGERSAGSVGEPRTAPSQ